MFKVRKILKLVCESVGTTIHSFWYGPDEDEDMQEKMFGLHSERYLYAGQSRLTTTHTNADGTEKQVVKYVSHFFIDRDDESRHVVFGEGFEDSNDISHARTGWPSWFAELDFWLLGHNDIYYMVSTPTDEFKDFVEDEYSLVWSEQKRWWIKSDQKTQQNGNVIKVAFKREVDDPKE